MMDVSDENTGVNCTNQAISSTKEYSEDYNSKSTEEIAAMDVHNGPLVEKHIASENDTLPVSESM